MAKWMLAIHNVIKALVRFVFSRTMIVMMLLAVNFLLVFGQIYSLLQGLPYLFGSMVIFVAAMEMVILNDRSDTPKKLSWAVIVAVLPVLGAALYFFVRYDIGSRLNRRTTADSIRESEKYLSGQPVPTQELREQDPALYGLSRYLMNTAQAPIYQNTSARYFPSGEAKFEKLLTDLASAEKYIFLEYFLISRGYMWNSILDILSRKVKEGVEVRLLYDGMNTLKNLPYGYPKTLRKLGIQCKVYAPPRPFVSTHYNNRDHRKICVIDGRIAYTGGINLEDCYMNREERFGHWKDTAIRVTGDAVRSFTLMFLQMWNADEKNRIFAPYLSTAPAEEKGTGFVIPYGDNPMDRDPVGKQVYLHILNTARDFVYIMTPYLILDDEMLGALTYAAKRGVQVRIILPHIPDKKTAFALAKTHYRQLIGAGVRIYEYTPGFVHAKIFYSDHHKAVVGTINLDYRSFYHHFECAAYLQDAECMADIGRDFDETFRKCREVTSADVKKQSLMTRLTGAVLKVMAPLM